MNRAASSFLIVVSMTALVAAASAADATSPTAFTYRGELKQRGKPAEGTFDFEFRLFDEALGATALGAVEMTGIEVRDGAFTVDLDFGFVAFTCAERWLETKVRAAGGKEFVTLVPRQILASEADCVVTGDLTVTGRLIVGEESTATGDHATVGGGYNNHASDTYATVGGGAGNNAMGEQSTVGGGAGNSAVGQQSTVGGGSENYASGRWSTVGAGFSNDAIGYAATVPGGHDNSANGDYSFAAGRGAVVDVGHPGTFMWADSQVFHFGSANPNAFMVRATGGTWFVSAINPSTGAATTGVHLAGGSGSWGSISDRALKETLEEVDGREVLTKLMSMPIQTWSYLSQDPAIRHMGPTAQDFHAAFGLGEDERYITGIDGDGVALAAIQGLYRLVEEKDAVIESLAQRNSALEARLTALEHAMLGRE